MSHLRTHTFRAVMFATLLTCGTIILLGAQETRTVASPSQDSNTIQALLVEVRQLRSVLERSMLVVPRLQVAVQKMQFQQARVDRLAQQLKDFRQRLSSSAAEDASLVSDLKEAEARVSQEPDALRRKEIENSIKAAKAQLELQAGRE